MTAAAPLDGQAAVVTGGGAGIGRAAALALARQGADVAVLDIDLERAEAVAAEVEQAGRRGLAVQVDAMQIDDVGDAVASVDRNFGRIDVLVNNTGGVRPGRFVEQPERSWRRHIDLNLVSAFAATKVAAPATVKPIPAFIIGRFRGSPGAVSDAKSGERAGAATGAGGRTLSASGRGGSTHAPSLQIRSPLHSMSLVHSARASSETAVSAPPRAAVQSARTGWDRPESHAKRMRPD